MATEKAEPLPQVLALLWSRKSFRHMALASAANAFAVYSMNSWTASFFIRSYGLSSGEIGTWLALILGLGGALGLLAGGFLAERLAVKDARWYNWIPAWSAVITTPFAFGTYYADNTTLSLVLFIVPGFLATAYLGNTLAMVHGLVGLRMRALASASLFFVLNLIGLGMGPFSVGLLSDYHEPALGQESLRYAMLYVVPAASLWSALHFFTSARYLRADLAAAPA